MFASSLLQKFGYKYLPIEKLSSSESSDIYSVHSSPYEIQTLILFNKGLTEENFEKQLEIYSRLSQNKVHIFLNIYRIRKMN